MKRFLTGALLPAAFSLALVGSAALPTFAQNNYPLTADSKEQPEVPKGEVTQFQITSTKVFPGTVRDAWVYVPKQYDPKTPACVMVFQDGGGFQDRNGWRVPTVFDNLIARGEMPVTIGIFLNPGVVPAADGDKQLPRYNRSFEYDATDDRYVRFLTDEVFPELRKKYNLTDDPNGRAICGASSGGIAAFNAAWERPDVFRRVFSCIGSFTDLRGGNRYPPFIRKTEPKPIRVFLQDGSNDQDIYSGSWPIGNNDVVAALRFAGYDYRYVVGDGGHDGRQGTALLPDALRFIWHDWKTDFAVKPQYADRQPILRETLIPMDEWVPLTGMTNFDGRLCGDAAGNVWATTHNGRQLWKIAPDGQPLRLLKAPGVIAIAPAPGGKLYAVTGDMKLVSLDATGKATRLQKYFPASSITVDAGGNVYGWAVIRPTTDKNADKALVTREKGVRTTLLPQPKLLDVNLRTVALVPDQSLLLVSPPTHQGKYIASARLLSNGTLTDIQEYFDLALVYGHPGSGASGMTCDSNGWLYVATEAGIQMMDQAGRVNGIILPPPGGGNAYAQGVAWGGAKREYLYTTVGGKLYRRKTKAQGVVSSEPPIKPPGPRL